MMRFFDRDEIAQLLTLDDCIAAVQDVFRDYGERRIAPPQSLGVPSAHGAVHVKTAITNVFAAKINANFPDNPRRYGLPAIQGVIVVMDRERGTPLAILESTLITTLRTAAASAVAANGLAIRNARTMTVIGCGNQGRAHVAAMRRVRPIETVFAYDENRGRAAQLGIAVESLDEAIAASDIVVTCTPSRAPLLHARHFHPGLFIAAVGADNPDKQELAPELLARTRVVADVLEQSATMGDLHHAIAAGVMTRADVHGELADVVCGRVPARRDDDETFVFDSTGTALQDAAAASVVLRNAEGCRPGCGGEDAGVPTP
jgi:alanine dehydrogenase